MTQQPFSRPGAVDLSGLQGVPAAGAGGAGVSGAYTVGVTEQNFQSVLESSMSAAVLLVFYSSTRSPESVQLADDLQLLSNEFEGRFLLGRVDIETAPQIAQAMQIPSVPLVVLVAQGRPAPLLQDAVPLSELRAAITQVLQQLTTSGFAGRHQPRAGSEVDEETGEEIVDPRYVPAQDALERGDIDAAVAEYQKLVDANPADVEASAGLAMAQLLKRTEGVDLNQAREAAGSNPDDVAAQTMVADLDLLGGHVEDAFLRLINLVGRTEGDDRDAARTHLIGLFGAVGNEDPRVQRARRDLASALF
ncbi:tetratricopeptide repeat protein [Nocardioides marmorisolisilvae]|uniref:Co-chaperone YbbN n=1 Tax=Nocardioides marmorisolisilvae TaxID=1542737 RepID=A0A3N0DWK4_9ACTN|nr:tetratricopeptide repeat protein [Nocardioides marmorisolisilvae]RNL79994.1 co-chaperone YbbN [Nocardioides marmorisolisilvae]